MSDIQDIFNFDVMQVFTEDKKVVLTEAWHTNGQLCRMDGPALTYRSGITGQILAENWYHNGLEHREAAPALVEYAMVPQGARILEAYKWRGKLHRRGAPALIEWTPEGEVVREEWWIMGMRLQQGGSKENG